MTRGALAAVTLAVVGCNVEPLTHDACAVKLEAAAGCSAGALVVMSDYASTQVALADLDGNTRCGSLFSSAHASMSAVSSSLSGDVVLPSSAPTSGRAVLLDRYGTNVVTWLDAGSGDVLAQLPVGTGFEANLQDYVELDAGRALVSRWGENPEPGREPFDAGGDVLLLDTSAPAIVADLPLPRDGEWPPRPSGLTRVGDMVVVTLQRFSSDIRTQADGMLAGVEPDGPSVVWTLSLDGLRNCGRLTPSPDGSAGVVGCTGFIDRSGASSDLDASGLVLLDLTTTPPRELARFAAAELAGDPIQDDVEFYGARRVLVKTQTALHGTHNNRLLSVDLDGIDPPQILLEAASAASGGQGVVYGGMLCTPGCADTCLVADADRGVLQRFHIDAGGLVAEEPLAITGSVGLPPRDVGAL